MTIRLSLPAAATFLKKSTLLLLVGRLFRTMSNLNRIIFECGDVRCYNGGKQYRVKEGQFLNLEKIELETGATVKFDKILLVGEGDAIKLGAPYVQGCTVTGIIEDHGRADKINH